MSEIHPDIHKKLEHNEQRLAELEAQQSTSLQLVQQLFKHSITPLFILDVEGRLERLNQSAEVFLSHYSPRSGEGTISGIFSDESQLMFQQKLDELRETAEKVEFNVKLASSNGEPVSLQLSIFPLFRNGSFERVLASVRDPVSDRERPADLSIQDLAEEFSSETESVLITDSRGIIQYVNAAFEGTTGYRRSEVIGQNPRILNSGKHSTDFYRHLWNTIQSGRTFGSLVQNRKKSGQLFYQEQTIVPVLNSNGQIEYFVSSGRDQTIAHQESRKKDLIVSVSELLRSLRNRKQMVPALVDEAMRFLDMDAAALFSYSAISFEAKLERASGLWNGSVMDSLQSLQTLSTEITATRSRFLANEIDSDSRISHLAKEYGILSVAAVPLQVHEQPIGVLWIGDRTRIYEQEVDLLATFGDLFAAELNRATLHEQTERRLQRLTALHAIDKIITSGVDLRVGLDIILGHVIAQLSVDAASILLLNPNTYTMDFAAGRGFKGKTINELELPVGEGFVGQSVLRRETIKVPNIEETQRNLVRNTSLIDEGFSSYFVTPLISKQKVEGVLELFHRRPLYPDTEWLSFFRALGTQAAIAIDNATMFDDLRSSHANLASAYDATIEGWARALEMRDAETQGHALRVTATTLHLARTMGIPEFKMEHVRRGALLHDIGKLGIPDQILYKPGPLNDEEWQIMRKHPEFANRMLSHVDYLRPALHIPYCHHEKWAGGGYPQGLSGDQIPQEARIFAIIDVWDALRSDRPYRQAWDEERVVEYVKGERGKQFDPEVVDVFCDQMETLTGIANKSPQEVQLPT